MGRSRPGPDLGLAARLLGLHECRHHGFLLAYRALLRSWGERVTRRNEVARPRCGREPYDIPVFAALVLLHVGALAALFQFSWFAVGLGVVLYWLTCSVGISLGFHRLLSHRSFVVASWLRSVILAFGCLALQGRPFYWVGVHRLRIPTALAMGCGGHMQVGSSGRTREGIAVNMSSGISNVTPR